VGFDKTRSELSVKQELALLVGVSLPDRPWNEADPLGELRGLAETAGATVVGELTQKRQQVQLGTYLGSGKLRQLADLAEAKDADVIIFDNELTPSQGKALEQATKCKVLDRSELILDIFATRARTAESRLQVELAQLEYSLPRLKRMWTHLSRVKAGIGMRVPGETQLEEDRRLVEGGQQGYASGLRPGPAHRLEQRILQQQALYRRLMGLSPQALPGGSSGPSRC